jgi:hypothetical protein
MRRAEGSLTTGTYIAITQVDNKDRISRARSNGVGHDVVGTKDKNDENVEVRTILTATRISHPNFLVVLREPWKRPCTGLQQEKRNLLQTFNLR